MMLILSKRDTKESEEAAVAAGSKEAPKRAPKRKAKAAKKKDDEAEESEEDKSPATPRRQLFQSSGDEDEAPPRKVVPPKELKEKFENEMIDGHKRTQRGKQMKKGEKLSPFAKKEKARRKKVEEQTMQGEATEDNDMQSKVLHHMKKVKGLDYDQLKEYLVANVTPQPKTFHLNCYWGRPATGVKAPQLGDGTLKRAPEVAYFGRFGTAATWNSNVTCTFVAAALLVSRLGVM